MKVSELEGAALDEWVARANGRAIEALRAGPYCDFNGPCVISPHRPPMEIGNRLQWAPSARWDQAGPIIERERINLTWIDPQWSAEQGREDVLWEPGYGIHQQFGKSLLAAAMRCFVASQFGEEVSDENEGPTALADAQRLPMGGTL